MSAWFLGREEAALLAVETESISLASLRRKTCASFSFFWVGRRPMWHSWWQVLTRVSLLRDDRSLSARFPIGGDCERARPLQRSTHIA